MNTNLLVDDSWKRKATLYLISQNLSLFGSSVVSFSVVWYITLLTSSGKWVMLFTICSTLPQVLISLWAGVWADRYNRKYIIMLADGSSALISLGLAIAIWSGYESLEVLLVAACIRSICSGIQTPAVNAMYPQIVPMDKLTKVQGINQTLMSVLMLLSPAMGGVLLGFMDISWAFMVDVITASLAVVVLNNIEVERVSQSSQGLTVMSELREGINYVLHNKLLRMLIIGFGVSFFLITPAAVLTPLYVERTFGSDVWRLTANEMVWTIGSLIGGVFVALKGEFKNKNRTVAICLVAFGVAYALLGIAGNFMIYLMIMGISGLFMPVIGTAYTVMIQENVEAAVMGRVFSLVQIVTGTAMPAAILLFGPLADIVSIASILIVTGVLLALVGVLYRAYSKRVGLD